MTGPIHGWLRRVLFLPPEASTVAPELDALHFSVIGATLVGATVIALVVAWLAFRYRHRGEDLRAGRTDGDQQTPAWVEWATGLGLFALFLGWWLVGFRQYVRLRVAPEGAYEIYVTGKQWMWKFAYPEGAHSLGTLYAPAGRPVKLLLTSRDVIHSLFVPDLRLKQDALPGRYTTLWFEAPAPGRHEILCAELCGTGHSSMRGELVVLPPAQFSAWLASGGGDTTAEAPAPVAREPAVPGELGPSRPMSLVRLGEDVAAQQGCLRCHTLDGTPHIGPSFAGLYRATVTLADGSRALADEAYLTEAMMDPAARVRAGYRPVMPSYLGRLRPAETAALLALMKALAAPPTPGGAGLPPPGSVAAPPMRGTVEVGPGGPR